MIKLFSNGGGVQSTAVLVLCAEGVLDYKTHIFANVGDNAESPETIKYIKEVLKPYANQNGIRWIDVCKKDRNGLSVDLYDYAIADNRAIVLPVKLGGSGAPANRCCTSNWKIKPVANYIRKLIPFYIHKKANVYSSIFDKSKKEKIFKAKQQIYRDLYPVILGKGISTDEIHRAKNYTGFPFYDAENPLIDLELSRQDCINIVVEAGLPEPPKSSCWFCPFKSMKDWQQQKLNDPKTFQKSVNLERYLSDKGQVLGRGKNFFTSIGCKEEKYLDELLIDQMNEEINLDFCESGFCGV